MNFPLYHSIIQATTKFGNNDDDIRKLNQLIEFADKTAPFRPTVVKYSVTSIKEQILPALSLIKFLTLETNSINFLFKDDSYNRIKATIKRMEKKTKGQ